MFTFLDFLRYLTFDLKLHNVPLIRIGLIPVDCRNENGFVETLFDAVWPQIGPCFIMIVVIEILVITLSAFVFFAHNRLVGGCESHPMFSGKIIFEKYPVRFCVDKATTHSLQKGEGRFIRMTRWTALCGEVVKWKELIHKVLVLVGDAVLFVHRLATHQKCDGEC